MELCDQSASELIKLLGKGEVSSRDITESVLKRIDEKEGTTNAYITVTRDIALKQADDADRRFREGKKIPNLNGIPIAIKDILCTNGTKTTCASKILGSYIPPYDATAVQKVLRAGAVMVGKTNMMGSSNENSAFGPARNPINPEYVTGGSSGGSAAAVAAGETILALGTDTGGSIRQPSAYCGIAYASSLDQVGALGRSVEDCAMLLNVISGHDRLDTTSADVKRPDFLKGLKKGGKGIKIGLPREYFIENISLKDWMPR